MGAGPDFGGSTYNRELDHPRLTTQLEAVLWLMSGGSWWYLETLAARVSELIGRRATEAAVSARIRDLRKEKFGGLTVEHERVAASGLWRYRLKTTAPAAQSELF